VDDLPVPRTKKSEPQGRSTKRVKDGEGKSNMERLIKYYASSCQGGRLGQKERIEKIKLRLHQERNNSTKILVPSYEFASMVMHAGRLSIGRSLSRRDRCPCGIRKNVQRCLQTCVLEEATHLGLQDESSPRGGSKSFGGYLKGRVKIPRQKGRRKGRGDQKKEESTSLERQKPVAEDSRKKTGDRRTKPRSFDGGQKYIPRQKKYSMGPGGETPAALRNSRRHEEMADGVDITQTYKSSRNPTPWECGKARHFLECVKGTARRALNSKESKKNY